MAEQTSARKPAPQAAPPILCRTGGGPATLVAQRAALNAAPAVTQLKAHAAALANRTGLPDRLKAGVEALSGLSLDHVRVHHGSPLPGRIQAHAYARGSDIHLAPGQAHQLPHEAWHVVQQMQGRVRPTLQLRGIAINDHQGLEHEADVMGARALSGSHAVDNTRLGRSGVSAATILQARKWQYKSGAWHPYGWVAKAGDTFNPGAAAAATAAAAPAAAPTEDEIRDDGQYTQASDPSVVPFLHGDDERMGGKGYDEQVAGITPPSGHVRVTAVQTGDMRAGAGAHEFYPTNPPGPMVGNPELAAFQSGARSATDHTLLINNNVVAAHTGMFPHPVTAGSSTHTAGQKPVHDAMRNYVPPGASPVERNLQRTGHALASFANGPQIMGSDFITGALPNHTSSVPLQAPAAADAERIRLAQDQHERREHAKARLNDLYAGHGFAGAAPASPEREPMEDDGTGGGPAAVPKRARSPVPDFPEADPHKRLADEAAYVTAPLRHGADLMTRQVCAECDHSNAPGNVACEHCGTAL